MRLSNHKSSENFTLLVRTLSFNRERSPLHLYGMAFLNHLIHTQLQRKWNVLCIHMQSFLIRGVACSVMGPIICGQTVILISFRSTGLRSCVITCHTSFVDCKNATRLFPGHNLVAISFRKHRYVQFSHLPPYLFIFPRAGIHFGGHVLR